VFLQKESSDLASFERLCDAKETPALQRSPDFAPANPPGSPAKLEKVIQHGGHRIGPLPGPRQARATLGTLVVKVHSGNALFPPNLQVAMHVKLTSVTFPHPEFFIVPKPGWLAVVSSWS
jgi:hypothetical protein